jgi:hypothetical protein
MPVKKKTKTNPPKEQRLFRSWLGLLLLGPALFFIYYLLTTGGSGSSPENRVVIPSAYREAGAAVSTDQGTITAAPGGRVLYSPKLVLDNNTIMPEGGKIFAVVPLGVPEDFAGSGHQWYIACSDGSRYNPLKTVNNNPAGGDLDDPAPESRIVYLIFKLAKDQKDLYLVYAASNPPAAWKLPRYSGD